MSKLELDHTLDGLELDRTLDELALAYLAGTATYAQCQGELKVLGNAAFDAAKALGAEYGEAFDAHWQIICTYNEKVEYHHYRLAEKALNARLKADWTAFYEASRKNA